MLYFYLVRKLKMHKTNGVLTLKVTTDGRLLNEQKSQAGLVKQQLKVNTTTSNSSERSVI